MRVSGVKYALYWGSSFTIDYAWYLTVAVALIISLKAFNVAAFASGGAIGALVSWGYGENAIALLRGSAKLLKSCDFFKSVLKVVNDFVENFVCGDALSIKLDHPQQCFL